MIKLVGAKTVSGASICFHLCAMQLRISSLSFFIVNRISGKFHSPQKIFCIWFPTGIWFSTTGFLYYRSFKTTGGSCKSAADMGLRHGRAT